MHDSSVKDKTFLPLMRSTKSVKNPFVDASDADVVAHGSSSSHIYSSVENSPLMYRAVVIQHNKTLETDQTGARQELRDQDPGSPIMYRAVVTQKLHEHGTEEK